MDTKPKKDKLEELLESLKRKEQVIVKISMKDLTLTGSDAIRYKMFSALKTQGKDETEFIKLLFSIGLLHLSNTFGKVSLEILPLKFLIRLKQMLDKLSERDKNA